MKAFGILFLYFFTWRSVIIGSVVVGLALVALASSLSVLFPGGAAASTGLAFVLLLAVPFISAPMALRAMIGNRRLAMVPGLPVAAGLVVLLLTLLTSLFLPFSAWLMGAPPTLFWLGARIFVVASLYMLAMQVFLTTRYFAVLIQSVPIILLALTSLFREQLWRVVTNNTAAALLSALTLAAWIYALAVMARKRNFKPRHIPGTVHDMDTESLTYMSSRLRIDRVLSPTASLLLGYPANIWTRAWNQLMLLVLQPLLSVLLMQFMARNDGNARPLSAYHAFLVMGLFVSFVVGALQGADSGARARLLWLRLPGARVNIWEELERELWVKFLLQLGLALAIAGVFVVLGRGSAFVLHYVLLLFTLALYQNYLLLCSRVNRWNSLTLALVTIASLAATGFAIFYSVRAVNLNLVLLLELCLLLLGALFRALAKFGFNRVDWQVLRYAASKRAAVAS